MVSPIFAKEVARILQRKAAGLSFLDQRKPIPEPDYAPALPAVEGSSPTRFVVHPNAGPATRKPPLKHAGTTRGRIFHKNTIVYHESELEKHCSINLIATKNVKFVYSQFPVFEWRDGNEKLHEHTADFYVEYEDGFRQALLVKHEKKRAEMEVLIERIIQHGVGGVVDDIQLLTETFGNRNTVANSGFILWSRKHHDEEAVEILLGILSFMEGHFRFGDLLRGCNDVFSRRVAIWRLIDMGVLVAPSGERISELTWLMKVATH